MNLRFMANIESFGDAGFVAWVESVKGLVVEGTSLEETINELLISMRVKIAFDYGLKIENVKAEAQPFTPESQIEEIKKQMGEARGKIKHEFPLGLVSC